MFNWTDNVSIPKISDLNWSETPPDVLRIFTYVWVLYLGAWFFAAVIGVIAAALYVKYENALVPAAWLIISLSLLGGTSGVLFQSTDTMPSAAPLVYIFGLIVAFLIGIVFYMVFVSKRE